MRGFAGLFLATAVIIAAGWWWLGRPTALPPVAADPGRIQCMSYAPFRADQSPLVGATIVQPFEIEEDLGKLARLTGCVRTYSIQNGLDAVPAIAARLGLKVLQGLWLGSDREKNRREIDATVALAKQHRDVITGIIVGNEVLLRGELAAEDIAAILREVKAATAMPVTYADVWEYWLRNRDLAQAVDFVTIHILPYWEDFPIAAEQAGAHVDAIWARLAASFPGKDILIGEVGWPSEGRMREGALPSPSNQARVLAEVMARARAKNYRVNLIEAFDQPWKRQLEGTVGGYWGLFGSTVREPKFAWGEPVSDHPGWAWQLAGGLVMAGGVFAAAAIGRRTNDARARQNRSVFPFPLSLDLGSGVGGAGVALIAVAAGITAPWALANAAIESLGLGGGVRGAALVAVAVAAPLVAAAAVAADVRTPPFSHILAGSEAARPGSIAWACGAVLMATTILALQTALGLVFDPRYRDFAFAQLTAAAVPFAILAAIAGPRMSAKASRSRADSIAAATLAGAALYIIPNESLANWQALWFAAALIVLAVTLVQSRDARST